jgi:aryl-alcohol dehydrogenase-like predicted oxidoreductase
MLIENIFAFNRIIYFMLKIERDSPYLIIGALGFGSFLSTDKSFEILNKAAEVGLVDVDCAASYGNGFARNIIGQFHKLGGKQFNIWEKIGLEMQKSLQGTNEAITAFPESTKLNYILNQMLDLYKVNNLYSMQLHAPLPKESRLNFLASLNLEKESGKFYNFGISNHDTNELKDLELECSFANLDISSNQVHFNVAEQRGKRGVIAYSSIANIPIVANRTLARGLLSHEKYENSLRMSISSRVRSRHESLKNYYDRIKLILAKVADRPISETAISWVLNQKGICAVTLGVSSVSQVDSAIRAIKFPLEKTQVELIDSLITESLGDKIFNLPVSMFDRNY